MGLDIDREQFAPEDYERFSERLRQSLDRLASMLATPGFGTGPPTVGAELEVSLIDEAGAPLPLNQEVLRASLDPRLTVELDRFNLECNLRHGPLAGRPFEHLRAECVDALGEVERAAASKGARVVMIGILPTLRERDLQAETMTDTPRFRALSAGLRRLRRGPFRLDIHGEDDLVMMCDDVTFEGAATSLQLHLRVDPGAFADTFNAVQLATAPALAACCNSPILLRRKLWEETRVALFKQAVDSRSQIERTTARPRVSFGGDWVRTGALEIFEESVALHEPLLPILDREAPDAPWRGVSSLRELRLHQGTVWSWNRPIYDAADGGHLRIEMRALPAGPSVVDMVANAALLIGLTLGLAPDALALTDALAFEDAHAGFYLAARHGLDAELTWPSPSGPARRRAGELLLDLLPIAQSGLDRAGVERSDSSPWLELIARRVESGLTGSRWQLRALERLEARHGRDEALVRLLERYVAHGREGAPVHEWPEVSA